jgi:hypothetical protein
MSAIRPIKNGLIKDEYGENQWYLNGERHRIDGPAVESTYGNKQWWLNGKEYSFDEYIIDAKWSDEQIIMWKLRQ